MTNWRRTGFATVLMIFAGLCRGQVVAPNSLGVRMGHYHLNAANPDAQRRFWTDVIGAKAAKLATLDVLVIPGAILFINQKEPTGGTDGSSINHIGVKVRDLPALLRKAEAARIEIISRNEKQAMLLAPDGLKLELTADPEMPRTVANHHIHFYTPDIEATRRWYVEHFGAVPGKRAQFEAADLPGVNLSFSQAKNAVSPTKGRVLDHIGFEVKDLRAFAKNLESKGIQFDISYRNLETLGVAVAFLTDPWGNYVELTEGLTQVQ